MAKIPTKIIERIALGVKRFQPILAAAELAGIKLGIRDWKRNGRTGHLFGGRYKPFPLKTRDTIGTLADIFTGTTAKGSKPLRDTPESYPYSTFGGYARKS